MTSPVTPVRRRLVAALLGVAVVLSGLVVAPAQAADTTPPTAPKITVDRWLPAKSSRFSGLWAWYPRATWTASRDAGRIAAYQVQRRTTGEFASLSPWATIGRTWRSPDTRSVKTQVYAGAQVCLRVRARDAAGNVGPWSPRRCTTAPITPMVGIDPYPAFVTNDGPFTHDYAVVSTRLDDFITRSRHRFEDVRGVRVKVRTGPDAGRMKVYVGKHYLGTVNARSDHQGWHSRKILVPADEAGSGRIRFVPVTRAPVHLRFVWAIR
ncbi:hypothetical protein ATJ88_2365 [Isoptericola jiangsuensis]|uniref:Fibronectin type-III domain-containing protein n=1 Tax=Isoptericola jiangsuensis TaxID=548579 RepID=A0A2A9EZS8_9MICO|nr:hypothetical protein [Isoptericola jiangsuensis]PFG43659.1 hypothetical protein ATJ88_2365 [Isoptericola jiangsuensis]